MKSVSSEISHLSHIATCQTDVRNLTSSAKSETRRRQETLNVICAGLGIGVERIQKGSPGTVTGLILQGW